MSASITSTCLPVTALSVLDLKPDWEELILAAEGPYLRIFSAHVSACIHDVQIFSTQSIHGISIRRHLLQKDEVTLVLWGGRYIYTCILTVPVATGHTVNAVRIRDALETELQDWALQAAILVSPASHQCLETAVITAHNVLYLVRQNDGDVATGAASTVEEIGKGLKSILYCSQMTVLSPRSLLIVSGTMFGEVLIWSCIQRDEESQNSLPAWTSYTQFVFRAHQGSVFGVAISDEIFDYQCSARTRFLASCSDDRTIQVRAIGLGKVDGQKRNDLELRHGLKGYETGFGITDSLEESANPALIASVCGHASRIWGVRFIKGASEKLYIVSRGEDATLVQWELSRFQSPTNDITELQLLAKDKYHSGRNVWALETSPTNDRRPRLLTGGADGSIALRPLHGTLSPVKHIETPFETLSTLISLQDTLPSEASRGIKRRTFKNYCWVTSQSFIVASERGSILQGQLEATTPTQVNWACIDVSAPLGSYPVLSSSRASNIALIGTDSGDLWLFKDGVDSLRFITCYERKINFISTFAGLDDTQSLREGSKNCFRALVTCIGSKAAHLSQISENTASNTSFVYPNLIFSIPDTFLVTSALLQSKSPTHTLVLGSRAGALATYWWREDIDASEPISASLCERHIHGRDAVTDLVALPENLGENLLFLSCGRDGCYAIHTLSPNSSILQTIHRLALPFGPNIEGAFFIERQNLLQFYGFRSKHFVVYNESDHKEVFSIDCGGAHRSFAFRPDVQQPSAGTFLWTQASSFHLAKYTFPSHQILSAGGHGREIKTVACNSTLSDNKILFATGAEDTTIRLFTLTTCEDGRDAYHQTHILRRHTAGLQHLAWSRCGKYLLSSAGYEDLCVWKVTPNIPSFGLGVICEAELPNDTAVSDLRITNFDTWTLPRGIDHDVDESPGFLLAAVYSNSVLKVFFYDTGRAAFKLLHRGTYKSNCLTQVNFFPSSSSSSFPTSSSPPYLLTASTDGSIALWPLPTPVSNRCSFSSPNSEPPTPLHPLPPHPIHQSSIKCLTLHPLSQSHTLIATGGDDNALALTLLSLSNPTLKPPKFNTLIIPKAHSASITGLSLLPSSSSSSFSPSSSNLGTSSNSAAHMTLYTVSCDQRFKTWQIDMDLDALRALVDAEGGDGHADGEVWDAVEVRRVRDEGTCVADAGGMDVVRGGGGEDGGGRAVVVGVGFEVRRI
ncbi:MAG: hypothetical protein Q9227_004882 [Pyrenula ochraceoflavens]